MPESLELVGSTLSWIKEGAPLGGARLMARRRRPGVAVVGLLAGILDVFVRDLLKRTTTLASRTASGAKANKSSYFPSLSADGRYLSFNSEALNLHPGTRDWFEDVFVRDVRAPLPVAGRRPRSRIDGVRRGKYKFLVFGRASDDHELQRVDVSLTRRVRTGRGWRCQATDGETWQRSGRTESGCRPRFLLPAHSTRHWQRGFTREVAKGTYTLTSRVTDTAGQRETRFSKTRGNVRSFRVP